MVERPVESAEEARDRQESRSLHSEREKLQKAEEDVLSLPIAGVTSVADSGQGCQHEVEGEGVDGKRVLSQAAEFVLVFDEPGVGRNKVILRAVVKLTQVDPCTGQHVRAEHDRDEHFEYPAYG